MGSRSSLVSFTAPRSRSPTPLEAKDACDQVDCVRVFALRDKILEALFFHNTELHTKLYPLLRCLARVPVTRQVLAVTGIGHLLSDASLWSKSTEPRAAIFARVLRQKWISEVRNSAKLFDVHSISTSSLKGFKNEPFLDSINSWAVELEQFEKPPLDRHLRISFGMVLALHGFLSISHLNGLEDVDIDCITSAPIFKSLLKRLRCATLPSPQVNPQFFVTVLIFYSLSQVGCDGRGRHLERRGTRTGGSCQSRT